MLQNGGNLHSRTQMGVRYFKWSLEVKMYFLIEKTFKYFCLKQQASHKNGFRSLLQKMLYSVHLGRGIIIATIDHAGECAADTEHSGDTPHAHCHNHNIIYHIKNRVHKSPHKFMLTSYMKYFDKFLALLLHNTSFFHFYFIFHTS